MFGKEREKKREKGYSNRSSSLVIIHHHQKRAGHITTAPFEASKNTIGHDDICYDGP
jgi:hypothetical protein